MRLLIISTFLLFLFIHSKAQLQVGIMTGLSNYEGDLDDEPFKPLRPAFGITAGYQLSNHVFARAGITLAKVAGADRYGKSDYQKQTRNLSFESTIKEISLTGELTIFNTEVMHWSPYLLGGVALFHFNPYTFTTSGEKVYLKPLSTEGQGLSQYPDRKPYALTQFALPFGGGLRYNLSDNVQIRMELGIRKLFTDYLDDISTSFIDPAILLSEKGPLAVDLSYRGDEVPGETDAYPDNDYPSFGASRGSPKGKDWYYFSVVHLTFRLGSLTNRQNSGYKRRGYGCPALPM
ncbi:MAG: outer membrane beta-barrel protein [Flavisolibacter sp.]|nr:outer membrane beta-barrel protein [Flavisolibacter sp.]